MNIPKAGDRIRLTDEGVVSAVFLPVPEYNLTRVMVRRDDGSSFFIRMEVDMRQVVEVIEPHVVGGIYMDSDGEIFRYNGTAGDWNCVWTLCKQAGDYDYPDGYPSRPLKRLDGAQ